MSKDKGTKNHKKTPAGKSSGKGKILSAYKAENKNNQDKLNTLEPFIPKVNPKTKENLKP